MAYERTHEGLRVVGGDFVVLADADGRVVGSSVAQEAPVDIASTTAQVPADRAAAVAKGQVDEVSDASAPELVIWHRDAGTRLAYEVEVRGTDAGEVSWQKVWVDAKDGSVLEAREQIAHGSGTAAYSGPNPLPIATSGSGSSYTMTDPTATTLQLPGRRHQHDVLRHRRPVGQRRRDQPRDRLRRRALRRPADEGA